MPKDNGIMVRALYNPRLHGTPEVSALPSAVGKILADELPVKEGEVVVILVPQEDQTARMLELEIRAPFTPERAANAENYLRTIYRRVQGLSFFDAVRPRPNVLKIRMVVGIEVEIFG